jgi:hypothetical protein
VHGRAGAGCVARSPPWNWPDIALVLAGVAQTRRRAAKARWPARRSRRTDPEWRPAGTRPVAPATRNGLAAGWTQGPRGVADSPCPGRRRPGRRFVWAAGYPHPPSFGRSARRRQGGRASHCRPPIAHARRPGPATKQATAGHKRRIRARAARRPARRALRSVSNAYWKRGQVAAPWPLRAARPRRPAPRRGAADQARGVPAASTMAIIKVGRAPGRGQGPGEDRGQAHRGTPRHVYRTAPALIARRSWSERPVMRSARRSRPSCYRRWSDHRQPACPAASPGRAGCSIHVQTGMPVTVEVDRRSMMPARVQHDRARKGQVRTSGPAPPLPAPPAGSRPAVAPGAARAAGPAPRAARARGPHQRPAGRRRPGNWTPSGDDRVSGKTPARRRSEALPVSSPPRPKHPGPDSCITTANGGPAARSRRRSETQGKTAS